MAKTVVMPQMGYDMDAGTLLRWLKQEGDQVVRGEPIAEIETDKVNIEIEAFDSGVLRKTLITEGQTVPVGEAIAIIGEEGEELDASEGGDSRRPPTAPLRHRQPEMRSRASQWLHRWPQPHPRRSSVKRRRPPTAQPQVVDREPGERIRASPLVRRLSEEHGIDLSHVNGTGPHGRIVKRDIEGMMTGAVAKPAAQPEEVAAAAERRQLRARHQNPSQPRAAKPSSSRASARPSASA